MPSSAFKTCARSEEHTSELQSHDNLVCRLLLEKKLAEAGHLLLLPSESLQPPVDPRRAARRRLRNGRPRVCGQWCATPPDPRRFFFFNDAATTEIYALSLHAALPI